MRNVILTTSSVINPFGEVSRGGWAYILRCGSRTAEDAGGSEAHHETRMEMQAIIEGLLKLNSPCEVLLNSCYFWLLERIEHDRFIWKARGWREDPWSYTLPELREREPAPVPNADLWQRLDAAAEKHIIHHPGSRSGYPDLVYSDVVRSDNRRCSQLASSQAGPNLSWNTSTTI
jgi:ribonuclease HI